MNDVMISAHGYLISAPELSEAQMQTRAYRDAIAAIARDIPDPAQFARYLPLEFVEALLGARYRMVGGDSPDNGWVVYPHQAAMLRPYGLVAAGTGPNGCLLTAFGITVRRALVAEDA